MKHIALRFISCLALLAMLLTSLFGGSVAAEPAAADDAASGDVTSGEAEEITAETLLKEYSYSSPDEKLATMELVLDAADTYGYRLYALEMTGEVAVEDVKTGQILFTNPYDAGGASTQDDTLRQLFSQISVEYTDNANKTSTMYSYEDAALSDQIRLYRVKNGIRMDYTIGRSDTRRLCPLSIEKSRYEEVLLAYIQDPNDAKKFRSYYTLYDPFTEESEAVKQSWLDKYPVTEEMAIYVMAESSTNYEKNKVESIIRAWCPHYTYEDLQNDHEMTKFVAQSEVMPVFKMSLEYKLDAQGLTVRLPANSVSFNEDYYTLENISILPYFGAGSSDYEGYTFVPDGSGSIIRFEDIKDTTYLFTGSMYGPDYAYQDLGASFTGKAEVMRMPVFGLVENRGYFYKLGENGEQTDEIYCAHNNKELLEEVAHTCTEPGYSRYRCLACGEEIIEYTVNGKEDPPAHTFDDTLNPPLVVDPTCTEPGYTERTCTVCGQTLRTDPTPASHHYAAEGEEGYAAIAYDDPEPAGATTIVRASGCEGGERGYTRKVCTICGEEVIEDYTDPGHDYQEVELEGVTAAADCKTGAQGKAHFVCTKCGDAYDTDTYPEHQWNNPKKTGETIEVGPSTFEVYERTCKVCGKTEKLVDHNSTVTMETTPNFEHNLAASSRTVVAEASCTSYGYETGVCRVCGELSGEVGVVTPPSHHFESTVVPATCTEWGYTENRCTVCGYTVNSDYTEPAHTYVDTVVEPTCTTNGYTTHVCSVCGDTVVDSWTSAGHTWDYGITDINGVTTYTCTDCGATTHNGAYAEATRVRGNKIDGDLPLPPESDFAGMEGPAPGGATSGDLTSGALTSGDVTSEPAASGDVTSGATSEPATSGAASGDTTSGEAASGTGKVESDLTVPDGAYVKYIPRGFLAIVESGESLSTVTSNHGGVLHKYNSVYLSVNPRPSDQYNLADSLSVGEDAPWTVVSKRKYTGSYKLRILMIGEGTPYEASYSGMANAYRQYLKDKGVLKPLTADSRGVPLTMMMEGVTTEEETFLGFPYTATRPLTTFEDLKTITEDLAGEGIANLSYVLSGWKKKLDAPDKLKFDKVTGGDDGYRDFAAYAKEKNLGLYPDFIFSYGVNTRAFGGIRTSKHAVKTIDDRYVTRRSYNPVYQILQFGMSEGSMDDIGGSGLALSPSAFDYFYSLIVGDLTDLGYTGISVRDLGMDVNSDFDEDEPYNREDSKEFIAELLSKMQEDSGGKVLTEGGNAYVLPYVSTIVGMPLEGSTYLNTSASVPFTGMVLHGYVNYSGRYTNEASDSRRETLKMIENGAYPYFLLAKQNTKLLVGSTTYSISYDSWRDDMVEIYNFVNGALSDLQDVEFVSHDILIGERVPDEDERARDEKANEEALAEAEENLTAARTAYVNAVDLYNRLIAEGRSADAQRFYTNASTTTRKAYADAQTAYNEALAAASERTTDYDEDGNYITTRYTVDDGSIVTVSYANGTRYILNYNNFSVKVTLDGASYTVPAFDYVKA